MSLSCAKPFPVMWMWRVVLCVHLQGRGAYRVEGDASFSPQLGSSRAFPCGEETVSLLGVGELYRGNKMMISPLW